MGLPSKLVNMLVFPSQLVAYNAIVRGGVFSAPSGFLVPNEENG